MIARDGKRYLYRCELCGEERTAGDLMGITEQRRLHALGNPTHLLNSIGVAMQPIVTAYAKMARQVIETVTPVMEQFQSDFALTNRPHDPALLRDKRKWGGR